MNRTLNIELARWGRDRLRVLEWMDRMARVVDTWMQQHRTRRQLAMADIRTLRDIGISEEERAIECGKRFWEA